MFVPASPGRLAPFPAHGMHCTLNPVVTVARFLFNYKLRPTLSMDVVGRLPCFSPAQLLIRRAARYIMCRARKEGKPAPVTVTWLPRLSAGRAAPHLQSATYLGQTTTTRPPGDQRKITRPEEDHLTTSTNFQRRLLGPLACGTLANMKTRLAAKRRIGWKPFRGFQKGAIFEQAAVNSQTKRLLQYNPNDIGEQS